MQTMAEINMNAMTSKIDSDGRGYVIETFWTMIKALLP